MNKDIENRKDIELLVDTFYGRLLKDPEMSKFFTGDLALDFEHHKPIMVDFWEFNLFQTPMKYMRNVMNPHIEVNEKKKMLPAHFEHWIETFKTTVDELFKGEKAEHAKESAFTIGITMQYKMKKLNE